MNFIYMLGVRNLWDENDICGKVATCFNEDVEKFKINFGMRLKVERKILHKILNSFLRGLKMF